MKRLKIEYETGYLEFDVEALFPFRRGKDKKIFKLINMYCQRQAKRELFHWLLFKVDEYNSECELFISKVRLYEPGSRAYRACKTELKKLEIIYKRFVRNLELLEMD